MPALPDKIIRLALEKNEGEPLTGEEQIICDAWTSGRALENMKIDPDDPNLFEYVRLLHKWGKQKAEVWKSFEEGQQQTIKKEKYRFPKFIWIPVAVAAAVAVVIYFGIPFYSNSTDKIINPEKSKKQITHTIAPGSKKAVLILANGVKKNLESLPTGIIVRQNGAEARKQSDSQLVYTVANDIQTVTESYDTLTTPNGGEYSVVLTDGTRVWVNANTSLRYPASFYGDERRVELRSGEAYFEVTHNLAKPFKVYANGTEVKAVGTRFNVKVYAKDNSVTTTLVDGLVQIQHGDSVKQMFPNQQVIVSGEKIQTRKVDIDKVLAWKNGFINLEGENIESIMQQLHNWYNVEVIIKGNNINASDLVGSLPKSSPLNDIIEGLNNSNINARFYMKGSVLVAEEKK